MACLLRLLVLCTAQPKVIVCGFAKTGTRAIAAMFQQLGFCDVSSQLRPKRRRCHRNLIPPPSPVLIDMILFKGRFTVLEDLTQFLTRLETRFAVLHSRKR